MTPPTQPVRMNVLLRLLAVAPVLFVLANAPSCQAQDSIVRFEPAQAKIEFSLGSTLHTVHGTFALKNSTVHFDPSSGRISGTLVVDATTGETGNSGRDSRMHREIIESAKFPEIVFAPAEVKGAVAPSGSSKVEVAGKFRLHGAEHDVTFPVEVVADGKSLQLTTHFIIPYISWGLKSPSNFFLKASDQVEVEVHATGHMESPAAQ